MLLALGWAESYRTRVVAPLRAGLTPGMRDTSRRFAPAGSLRSPLSYHRHSPGGEGSLPPPIERGKGDLGSPVWSQASDLSRTFCYPLSGTAQVALYQRCDRNSQKSSSSLSYSPTVFFWGTSSQPKSLSEDEVRTRSVPGRHLRIVRDFLGHYPKASHGAGEVFLRGRLIPRTDIPFYLTI
jgi:hypothetical protein